MFTLLSNLCRLSCQPLTNITIMEGYELVEYEVINDIGEWVTVRYWEPLEITEEEKQMEMDPN